MPAKAQNMLKYNMAHVNKLKMIVIKRKRIEILKSKQWQHLQNEKLQIRQFDFEKNHHQCKQNLTILTDFVSLQINETADAKDGVTNILDFKTGIQDNILILKYWNLNNIKKKLIVRFSSTRVTRILL